MSKRTIKVLSLILTLVMFLSVSTPGFAWGGGIGIGDGWGRDIGEDEVRDFEPEGEIEEKEEYDYFSAFDEESGINVVVEAPMGSLPLLAELRVEPVDAEAIRDAVNSVVEGEPEILVAMDISFWLDDIEIEPEEPVRVRIAAPELEGRSHLTVVHIPDEEEPETMELITDEDELQFKLGTNEVCFESGSFSTYAVTSLDWSGGTATIHWGYYDNDSFVPFEEAAAVDSGAATINLNVIFTDYVYQGAMYTYDGDSVELASPILTKVTDGEGNTSWTMVVNVTGEDEQVTTETRTIAAGSDIYAFYSEKGSGSSSPGQSPETVKGPETDKNVSDNGNGTYQIRLDITGHVEHTETRVGANVIIIFDNTKSMGYYLDGHDNLIAPDGEKRIDYVRPALKTLINTLDPDTHTINMAFVLFNLNSSTHNWGNDAISSSLPNWTQSGAAMLAFVDDDDLDPQYNSSGTNWETGLTRGVTLLNQALSDDTLKVNKTYVIFVTDGDPNRWGNNQGGPGYGQNDRAVQEAQGEANTLAANSGGRLYGIFCGSSSGLTRLQTLINNAYNDPELSAGKTIAATSPELINSAFQGIAQTIVNDLGATGVTADDGIPTLADVSTSVSGSAGGFHYYISYPLILDTDQNQYYYTIKTVNENNQPVTVREYVDAASTVESSAVNREPEAPAVYTITPGYVYTTDENNVRHYYKTEEWDGAPSAAYSASNGVTWNLSSENVLADETIYSLTFDVWPSQEAYDLLANLNNKMPDYQLDALDDATLKQLDVTLNGYHYVYVPGATEGTGTWQSDAGTFASTDDFLDAINAALLQDENAVYYNILTNTHLYTTYEYDGVTYTDPPKEGLVSGAMLLEDQTIGIVKYWHNDLDAQNAQNISLTITRDGVDYVDVVMGAPEEVEGVEHEWVQTPPDKIYISCGIMTVDGQNNITMNTTGHDYSVVEKEGSPWYWDLTAYVYHPMVVNSRNTMLILVSDEDKATLPDAITGMANNKVATSGGKTYYKFDNKLYVETDGATNVLRADNDRRSSLEIWKTVTGDNAPADDLFTFEITLKNDKTPHQGDDGYNLNYHGYWFVVLKDQDPNNDPEEPNAGTIATAADGLVVEGATPEVKDGVATGYYSFDNTAQGETVSVSIKPGWRICFTSVTRYTEYTVEEPLDDMPDGFVLDSITPTAKHAKENPTDEERPTPGVVNSENTAQVTGSIDKSNSTYYAAYDNRYVGFFYVYHSSNCTVQRFPFAEKGVPYSADKTFNIVELTAEGTLYGGYYSDYAGKSSGFDAAAARALDYSGENPPKDTGGKAYNLAYIEESSRRAWTGAKAYEVNGFAMVPVADTVYYLKEVPSEYLLPYLHYTYKLDSREIATAWLVSDLDDTNYTQTGFIFVDQSGQAKICDSLTVKTSVGNNTIRLTAKRVFGSEGVLSGYLTYRRVIEDYGGMDGFGDNVSVQQYWVTPDGLLVTGTTSRSYSGTASKDSVKCTEAPDTTPITVFAEFTATPLPKQTD